MTSSIAPLRIELWPRPVELTVDPHYIALAERVQVELEQHAANDRDSFYGYFPGSRSPAINHDLPSSQQFAQAFPCQELAKGRYHFNFLKLALCPQPELSGWHLDSDAQTALGGEIEDLPLVHRLLINLSSTQPRTVEYLDVDFGAVELTQRQGYITPDLSVINVARARREVELAPRVGSVVSAIEFCASRVVHRGAGQAHYLAGYGFEQAA